MNETEEYHHAVIAELTRMTLAFEKMADAFQKIADTYVAIYEGKT
jgi:hypothetical protein